MTLAIPRGTRIRTVDTDVKRVPTFPTHSERVTMALAAREPFKTGGSFRAILGMPDTLGRLPEEWCTLIRKQRDEVFYAVMSYKTPIAWVLPERDHEDRDRVIIPDVEYSPTTLGHQRLLHALYGDLRPVRVYPFPTRR